MFSATKGGSPSGYQISRSVRLRSSASAYLTRTPASAGNRRTFTLSVWVKRGSLGATQWLFDADNGSTDSTEFNFAFTSSDTLTVSGSLTTWRITTQVFRDPSAWYHILLSVDTTQATANNRIRLYVNGSEITAFGTLNNPTQNLDLAVNQTIAHYFGIRTGLTSPFDGYLTEINFIDGQALTPASFGETNPVTGVWQPKKYTGTYGTNGFYLNFSDNSAATAAAIGKDYSGNGNNWTPNNISVTAGVTYDSMLDVPTQWADGGNGRGNYCTLNPLAYEPNAGRFPNLSEANLKATNSANNVQTALGTFGISSGKFYCEFTVGSAGANNGNWIGVMSLALASGYSNARLYNAIGQYYNGSSWASYGATFTANDVLGIALDMDNQTLEFFKNGASQGQKTSIGLSGLTMTAAVSSITTGENMFANFGQRPFSYTPPSGFLALNTLNLPTPTILKGNQYFDVSLYTGNGATGQTITNSGGMQPDLVWVKSRSNAYDNGLEDSVRGATKDLNSNNTDAEETRASSITAFTSSGFTLGGNDLIYNGSGATYVAWQWKEGATQGFDIVTYTGNATNRTIAHNLGVAPAMIICKLRGDASGWTVWHRSFGTAGNTDYISLQSTGAKGWAGALDVWNGTVPTSSVFSLGTAAAVNQNTTTAVAYLFAEVAGFSKFGSYTGNGSADGPFVFCGFRPRFVLIKESSAAGNNWVIYDTARDTYNECSNILYPNLSNAEFSGSTVNLDILSNGFKPRDNWGGNNTNGSTYIYAAFAENPFKYSLAR